MDRKSKKIKEIKESNKLYQTEESKKEKIIRFFCHIFPAVILIALAALPIGKISILLPSKADVPLKEALIHGWKLPFEPLFSQSILHWIYFAIYLLPVLSLLLLVTLFKKDSHKFSFITAYVGFSIYILIALSILVYTSNCPGWFYGLPWYIYTCYGFAVCFHIFMTVYGLLFLRRDNEEYTEYRRIRKEDREKKKHYRSIKLKLNVTIITTITIILFSFMFLVLYRYHTLITEAVSDIGCSIAKQTASVYVEAGGMNEKIAPFFEEKKNTNDFTGSPYERIDLIKKSSPELYYIKDITPTSPLPTFDVFAYTTGKRTRPILDSERVITPELAHELFQRFENGCNEKEPVYDYENGTCKYYHPVTFNRVDGTGEVLTGFAVVTYDKDLLMEPFFKTEVFVFAVTFLFLYIAIIISFLLADLIVNPLLYLTKNVRTASNIIAELLDGSAKIEANSISFDDTITTKDEVKHLSKEIGNLVNIIRGIVPYISFSTLKNAEKNITKPAKTTSTARELCFLFTDIRGFTSLCEGMQPKDVVNLLNHYLDLETKIILNNGGDVDKFVGDEMMAFFAGPRKEYNACKAAMEIRTAMRAEQQKSKEAGEDFISIGIGINTGKVVFGPVGSKTRMDFTSIGDTVNLASRLEGANKAYGSKSIITEAVYTKLHDTFICRELDFITVKGKTEPVRIYEILQKKTNSEQKIFEIKELFEKGLGFYRKQKWENAEKYFLQCTEKYNDFPSIVFLDRISHFKENPPPKNWDGVFNMKVK